MSTYTDAKKQQRTKLKEQKRVLKNRLSDVKALKRMLENDIQSDTNKAARKMNKLPEDLRRAVKGSYGVNGTATKIENASSELYGLKKGDDESNLTWEINRLNNAISEKTTQIEQINKDLENYVANGGT